MIVPEASPESCEVIACPEREMAVAILPDNLDSFFSDIRLLASQCKASSYVRLCSNADDEQVAIGRLYNQDLDWIPGLYLREVLSAEVPCAWLLTSRL